MDLTRLDASAVERWLAEQAKVLRVPVAGLPSDQTQARLNEQIARRRSEGQRAVAIETVWRAAPFWLAAALFLLWELRGERREKKQWVADMALALLGITLLGATAFWLFPAGLTWVTDYAHRPVAYLTFYGIAILVGFFWSSRRHRFESSRWLDTLWVVGVAVWLLAYFGPLGYSLTRHGSLIVLTGFPIVAVVFASGWGALWAWPTIFLLGLLPVAFYDVESFNLKYPLLDRVQELSPSAQLILSAIAVALFVVVLRRAWLKTAILTVAWFCVGRYFFQFDLSKLIGGLCACCWLIGCLELFRRSRLPTRWFGLVSAIFLFLLLTFFLNGFALSHVDFRFAATKIFPFAKEVWRAPQLILWAALKYGFALLPVLAVIRSSGAGQNIWRQLLLLGWWRELTIVASALGLAIFNARGMRDLCEEEIYFWTFLNVVFFAAALILTRFTPSELAAEKRPVFL